MISTEFVVLQAPFRLSRNTTTMWRSFDKSHSRIIASNSRVTVIPNHPCPSNILEMAFLRPTFLGTVISSKHTDAPKW